MQWAWYEHKVQTPEKANNVILKNNFKKIYTSLMLISAIKSSVSSFFNGFLMHRNKNKKYSINKCFMRKSSFLFCILSRTLWKLEIKFYD